MSPVPDRGGPDAIHPGPHLSSLLRMCSSRAIIGVAVVRNTTSLERARCSRCQEMGFLANSGVICQSPRGSPAIFSDPDRTSFLADFCPRFHLSSVSPTMVRDGMVELPGGLSLEGTQ